MAGISKNLKRAAVYALAALQFGFSGYSPTECRAEAARRPAFEEVSGLEKKLVSHGEEAGSDNPGQVAGLQIPGARVTLHGNHASDRIVYYIPQVHIDEIHARKSSPVSEISACQTDIYETINYLAGSKGVRLLLVEGLIGNITKNHVKEIAYANILEQKKRPDPLYTDIGSFLDYYSYMKAEYLQSQAFDTVGVEHEGLLQDSITLVHAMKKIRNLYYSIDPSNKAHKDELKGIIKEQDELFFIAKELRSREAVRISREYLKDYGSAILVYGGGHTEGIIEAFGSSAKLYVIELESYRKAMEKIEGRSISVRD